MTTDIAVIGAGSYGTCLAMCFGRAGHRVELWCRDSDKAAAIDAARANSAYLPGHSLPDTVRVTSDLERCVRGKQFVVGVTPSHAIRDVLGRAAQWLDPDTIVINASKGLEDGSLATIDRIYREIFPARIAARATYLSGPTFAGEIAAGLPDAIVLAGYSHDTAHLAQAALQQIGKQAVIAEPLLAVIQRDQEQVRAVQPVQKLAALLRRQTFVYHRPAQLRVKSFQHRRLQEKGLQRLWLALEHFFQQVVADVLVISRKRGYKSVFCHRIF